jgi:hypothetical protein
VALAFAVLTAMILGAVLLAPPGRVHVPRLEGLTRTKIDTRLHRLPLRTAFTSRFDSAPPGTAIAQRPAPGARVADGSTVSIVLSAGPPPVEVPRVVGQSTGSARAILASLGLDASVTTVPAPGVQTGNVTGQSPAAGKYLRPHSSVALTVAETPQWRPVTSFAGIDAGHSTPFRIRGDQWRVVYRMSFVGTCTLILFCDGPSAQVVGSDGSAAGEFGMNDGGVQSVVERSGPGTYALRITPGSDAARWSMEVEDYY